MNKSHLVDDGSDGYYITCPFCKHEIWRPKDKVSKSCERCYSLYEMPDTGNTQVLFSELNNRILAVARRIDMLIEYLGNLRQMEEMKWD